MPKGPNKEGGSILIGVIVLGLLLTLAGGAMMLMSGHSAALIQEIEMETKRKSAAESGLRLALGWFWKHRPMAFPATFNATVNGQAVQVRLDQAGGNNRATSTVNSGTSVIKARCLFDENPPTNFGGGINTYQCTTYFE